MTGSRKTRAIKQTSKEALQFAPNFTAYVLPPDLVCLYSEDRKFFLHGELYCALASAVGKSGKSFEALMGELGGNFRPIRSMKRSSGWSIAATSCGRRPYRVALWPVTGRA